MKIILAGGSGFLGQVLAGWYAERGAEIVVLTRGRITGPARAVAWDGASAGDWMEELDGCDAVINLAGRSVDCRYTPRNKRSIMDSRVSSTRAIGEACLRCKRPPRVWINSSTATIYKHTFGVPYGEDGEIGSDPAARDAFSIEVARAWEASFEGFTLPQTRKITARTAVVFGRRGGALPVLRRLVRFGLGGKVMDGRQFVSWIHERDFCRAIEWLIEKSTYGGTYNLAAPNPISNGEMMRIFRSELRMPLGLPAPRALLEVGAWLLRTQSELVIKSRRVRPVRLLKEGFAFEFSTLQAALRDLLHGVAR